MRLLNICESSDCNLETQRLLTWNRWLVDMNFEPFNLVRAQSWAHKALGQEGFFVEPWGFPTRFSIRSHFKLRHFILDMNIQTALYYGFESFDRTPKSAKRIKDTKSIIVTDQNKYSSRVSFNTPIIVFTDQQKADLIHRQGLGQDRITVIPEAVNRRLYHPSQKSQSFRKRLGFRPTDFVMGCLSANSPYDYGRMIQLLASIRKTFLNVFLTLKTPKPHHFTPEQKRTLQGQIERAGLSPYLRWLEPGFSEHKVICNMDLLVQSLPEDLFGFGVLKPMAAGVPVLSLQRGLEHEILMDGRLGWLAQQDNPEDIYKVAMNIISQPKERAKKTLLAEKVVSEKYEHENIRNRLHRTLLS